MGEKILSDWRRIQEECAGIACEMPFSFPPRCSIGCGGIARAAFFPANIAEMLFLSEFFTREGVKFAVLGNMTNVLPPDGVYEGALIFTDRLKSIGFGRTVFATAGVRAKALLDACEREGRTGAEFLAGIPCSVGGAAFMNAGAGGRYFSDIAESVLVCRSGRIRVLSREECGYGYKKSAFMEDGSIVLGTSFALDRADGKTVKKKRAEYLAARASLPKGRSMGCVFKNPPEAPAGKLIEGAGMKGLRLGGAVVSEKHANFILNTGGATSSEIKALISVVKNAVFSQYGIALEEEIRRL